MFQQWRRALHTRLPLTVSAPGDSTPHRPRPPALRGLLVHHPLETAFSTGRQRDETVYSARVEMWSAYDGHFGDSNNYRHEYLPERMHALALRKQAYVDRWHAKYEPS